MALELASAAVAAAALTVRLNVAEVDDPAFAGQVEAALGAAEAAARGAMGAAGRAARRADRAVTVVNRGR